MTPNQQEMLDVLSSPPQEQDKGIVIYLAGPCPDGKFYVGQTENFKVRFSNHRQMNGSSPAFHGAIELFGFDLFRLRIIAQTNSPDEADLLERHFIQVFNSYHPHGYNMTAGGRAARFDPAFRVSDFVEMPVSESEIREQARRKIYIKGHGPGPNDYYDKAFQWLSQYLYQAIVEGTGMERLEPENDPKLLKLCRDLPDFLHHEEMARHKLGLQKLKRRFARPLALKMYAQRLFTHLKEELRVAVLRSRGFPFRHLKPFRPVGESDKRALSVLSHADYIRKILRGRFKLLDDGEGHEALVDAFLLEKKKGFEFSVGIAAEVGFPEEMVSAAAKEALERIQRGETLETYKGLNRIITSEIEKTSDGFIIRWKFPDVMSEPPEEQFEKIEILSGGGDSHQNPKSEASD